MLFLVTMTPFVEGGMSGRVPGTGKGKTSGQGRQGGPLELYRRPFVAGQVHNSAATSVMGRGGNLQTFK